MTIRRLAGRIPPECAHRPPEPESPSKVEAAHMSRPPVVAVLDAITKVIDATPPEMAAPLPHWLTATATTGMAGGLAPREPKKGMSPKEKMPPSPPTIR